MEEFLKSIVDKPFQFKGHHKSDTRKFRVHNSGSVFWIELLFPIEEAEFWDYHCPLIVMEEYIAAHSRFLNDMLERKLYKEDFLIV